MAVEIKSGNSTDLAVVDSINKALRVVQYHTDGTPHDHDPIPLTVNPVTVVNNDLLGSFDASAYKYISIQLTGTWVGTIKFQGSNDNGTFENIVVQNTGVVLEPYVLSLSANGGVKVPVLFKFLRIRVTSYTSGIVEGTAFGYQDDANTGQISTVGTININSGQTLDTVTNIQKLGGQDVAMGGGVVTAGTQRVTVATDTPVILGPSTEIIGNVRIAPGETLIPLFILGQSGAVDVNSGSVSSVPATIRAVVFTNYTATPRHFKLYNIATVPVAGTGVPSLVCSMAAAGTLSFPLPVEGFAFSVGIGYTMTLGAANTDVTPTATAPDFSVSLIYG
jgi:hypothetical protein